MGNRLTFTVNKNSRKNLPILASIFQLPVLFHWGNRMYEVNIPANEFYDLLLEPLIRKQLVEYGFMKDGKLTIDITGTGNWDHLAWKKIYNKRYDYSLPKIIAKH